MGLPSFLPYLRGCPQVASYASGGGLLITPVGDAGIVVGTEHTPEFAA
jgi:hypothetical protein